MTRKQQQQQDDDLGLVRRRRRKNVYGKFATKFAIKIEQEEEEESFFSFINFGLI